MAKETKTAAEFTGRSKRWFVLLVQDGSDIITQNPDCESFTSEKDAIMFAKQRAREDEEGGDGAVYHVMKTTHIVEAKRRVAVTVFSPK